MRKRTNFQIMLRLVGLVRPLLAYMLCAIALGILGFLCSTFLTVFGGYAMLQVLGFTTPAWGVLLGGAVAFGLLRGFLRYGEQACNHFIAFKLLALIRDKVFAALRRLCPAKLEGKDKGNLISIITSDIELLEVFYAHTLSPMAIALGMSVIMTVFIGSYHVLLGALAFCGYLAVGVALPLFLAKRSNALGAATRAENGALSGFVLESLRGLPELLQYGCAEKRLAQMQQKTNALLATDEALKRRTAQGLALTNTVILGFDLAMLCLTGSLLQQGAIGFDGALIALIALMSSFGPVLALANLGNTLTHTMAAGERVLDILDETPQVTEQTGLAATPTFTGAACKDVSFAYDGEQILQQFTLQIPQGKILGLAGRSGSGKSTVLRLLMRFWDAQQGSVQVSGKDVKSINTADLRTLQGFVTQDTHLFSGTIAENLRIAKLDATQDELEAACKKASVHLVIERLPNGYNTRVGELGDTLSGGERQRIGLARAFLHNAPLLLLDEPTSNLDSLNEAVILQSLAAQSGEKTVVLVSHRASTLRVADTVLHLESDRVS